MKIKAKPFAELDSAKQADGLIPAVIQDDRTLQVLMLGYMNREAYEKSLAEGRVTFYSRRAAASGPKARPAATISTSFRSRPTATTTRS